MVYLNTYKNVKYASNQLWKQKEKSWGYFIKFFWGVQDPKTLEAEYRMWKTK